MLPLKQRRARREHIAAVNRGEVFDPAVTYGLSNNAEVLGDDGKPVAGSAPKGFAGFTTGEQTGGKTGEADDDNKPFDYATLGTHADLDGEKGLNGREKPEGWDTMKVVEKQAWLEANRPAPTATGW